MTIVGRTMAKILGTRNRLDDQMAAEKKPAGVPGRRLGGINSRDPWRFLECTTSKMFRAAIVGAFAGCASLAAAQTTTLQAESATLSGVTVATTVAGFTG